VLTPPVFSAPHQDPAPALIGQILRQQQADGAIPDEPGGQVVNADSNLLYLLEGLVAQARVEKDPALWSAIECALEWLAARLWKESDPLPNAFPDALPLKGVGKPLGTPPTAAIGATAARFVSVVGQIPEPSTRLRESAKRAWSGLWRWNLSDEGSIWSAWQLDSRLGWSQRRVRYAADQADLLAGERGAKRLGLRALEQPPLKAFKLGVLALNERGKAEPLMADDRVGAWAVLAFDGPPQWRRAALKELDLSGPNTRILALAAHAYHGEKKARQRLMDHLREHSLPQEHEMLPGIATSNLAGFVLRALTKSQQRP
jgi:hypothetical protein